MRLPSPPPAAATFRTDPRIGQVQAAINGRPHAAALQAIHPYGAQRPEQCLGLIDWGFVNQTYLAYQRIPSYYEFYLTCDQHLVYQHHRRFLQHLQAFAPGEWVVKWPKHVFGLDALLEVYPDARIVWTHRDPGKVIPSSVSFVGTLRSMNSPVFDPKRFGAEWTALEEMGLHRGLAVRDRVGDDRFLDVQYNDLIIDPVAEVTRIYQHFGIPVDDETVARVRDFAGENPRGKHGAHQYTPEQFGFEPERLRHRFAAYTERFGIEPDRPRPDVWVNTAWLSSSGGIADYPDDMWRQGLAVNLVRSLALELGPHGIRVVAIAPAATDTPGFRVAPTRFGGADAEQARRLLDDTVAKMALGRLGQADDIARAVVFAASDMAGFITGSTLHVDGGVDAS